MSQDQLKLILGATIAFAPLLLIALYVFYWKPKHELTQARKALSEATESASSISTRNDKLQAENAAINTRIAEIEERFRLVLDLDAEAIAVKHRIALENQELEVLRQTYSAKRKVYDKLAEQIAIFDERLAFAELGVYEPHFDFSDSDTFKRQIEATRNGQKNMVTMKTAVVCPTQWNVGGSLAEGKAMTDRGIKLTLRAFNNECDAAIANTRWNNVNAMEKRIATAYNKINDLNEKLNISITPEYQRLKLQELYLTHEYREKLKAEREERAELARAQKEEAKLIRDMERAEEEEARYQRLLNKAKSEADKSVGPKLDALNAQISLLEKDLQDAHAKVERAQAMAEKTRSGYVYIISNVGSFGEDVVKIGLTRRLDPADRVRELGDASVPFIFDTHAIIYSEDAPALERALHGEFEAVRVNAQNYRKEFFRAKIEDVEQAVRRLAPQASFFRDIEAQEYRETLARRATRLTTSTQQMEDALPLAI